MHAKLENTLHFFPKESSALKERAEANANLLKQLDFNLFQEQSLELIKKQGNEDAYLQWHLFCKHVTQLNESKPEKMLLMQTAFQCLENPLEHGDLAQLIMLTRHLKSVDGLQLIQILLESAVPKEQRHLKTYLAVFQLLMDLYELPDIVKTLRATLPALNNLLEKLQTIHSERLTLKYPERNLDAVIARFAKQDELMHFPLQTSELAEMKCDYLAIKDCLFSLKTLSEVSLQACLKKNAPLWRHNKDTPAKRHMIAIIVETIRRKYSILPYDTQILSLLALVNTPDKLKGRIAQIKTGEGKSTVIAMLAAFMGAQGYFVDMVTSSGYLAKRDCKKYEPFFKALGLSASHISHQEPKQKQFHALILYGTNTDFEFAFLRDGLYHTQLRRSRRFEGELVERASEVVIIDEVDNLFLDSALSSAQMGITDHKVNLWIYEPIFRFMQSKTKEVAATPELIRELRAHLAKSSAQKSQEVQEQLANFSDKELQRLFESAHTAHFKRQKDKDYVVAFRKDSSVACSKNELEIIIVDYSCTGRTNEGSQWNNGVHQFLQIKEGLKLTSPTKTGASVSHPTFFNLYSHVLGLTGTMGEAAERKEIERIYGVGSFDVPPHYPSLRNRGMDLLLPKKMAKWEALLGCINEFKKKNLPSLILCKSIQESNDFSDYLTYGYYLCLSQGNLPNDALEKNTLYFEVCLKKEGNFIKYTVISPQGKIITDELKQSELKIDIARLATREQQKLLLSAILSITSIKKHTLSTKPIKHQLLNETQPEAEDYLIAQAGEPGIVTVATNTAGRGTDICLAPESKDNGGLQMIFTFYPDNLRVEDQGFGRAGRQGQPGSCWMILDAQDELICDLMHKNEPLKKTLTNHLLNQHKNTKPLSAQPIIQLLNELRTAGIQQQSARRSECAKQEQVYFGKLQDFFSKMAKVYALIEDKSFANQIIHLCTSNTYQVEKTQTIDEKNSEWISLKEIIKRLVEQSKAGNNPDWSVFSEQFTRAYLSHICSLWGSYYSKLKDPIETEPNRERAFHEVYAYLLEPEKMATSLVDALFSAEFERNSLVMN